MSFMLVFNYMYVFHLFYLCLEQNVLTTSLSWTKVSEPTNCHVKPNYVILCC